MRPARPIDRHFGNRPLSEATVQEIHLELFRRSVALESRREEFLQILLENRHLWRGAIMDKLGVNEGGFWLQPCSMIKLRDIDQNFWNADTLFVLCDTASAAEELARKLPMERFGGLVNIEQDRRILDRALGGRSEGQVVLRFWWD